MDESCLEKAQELLADLSTKDYPQDIIEIAKGLAGEIEEYESEQGEQEESDETDGDTDKQDEYKEPSRPFNRLNADERKQDLDNMRSKLKKASVIIAIRKH